jgi:hypothetical protein
MRAAARRARPQLVLYSQDVPAVDGAAHYVTNAATWATLPFDGLAVYSIVGSAGVFNRVDTLTSGDVSDEWDGFHAAAWGSMTHHWPLIRITDTNVIDLTSNTHWSTICANAATFAAGVKGSKVAGFLLDNEDYSGNDLFDYTAGGLSTMQAWARQRGDEFMTAIIGAWPEARVVMAHGPYISEPKTGVDVWSDQSTDPPFWNPVDAFNELSAWFTWGMGEATIGTHAKVFDGGEVYAARSLAHMRNVRDWQLNGLPNASGTITPTEIRGGAYPLGAVQAVFDRDEFNSFAEHDLSTIQTMLTQALRISRPMAWFYMEERDPYPGGLPGNTDESWKPWLTTAYTNMVAAARDAGRDLPPTATASAATATGTGAANNATAGSGSVSDTADGELASASGVANNATAAAASGDFVQLLGTNTSNTNSQTLSITFSGLTKPKIGDLVVLYGARDNLTNDPATADNISASPGSNSYTRVILAQPSGTSTASAGIVGVLFYSILTADWPSGDNTLSWNWGANRTGKVMRVEHYAGPFTGVRGTPNTAGGTTTVSVLTTDPVAGDLVLAVSCYEHSTASTITGDSDTTNGSWTSQTAELASGGTTTSAVKLACQRKRVTGTGNQSYATSNSTNTDNVGIVAVFQP